MFVALLLLKANSFIHFGKSQDKTFYPHSVHSFCLLDGRTYNFLRTLCFMCLCLWFYSMVSRSAAGTWHSSFFWLFSVYFLSLQLSIMFWSVASEVLILLWIFQTWGFSLTLFDICCHCLYCLYATEMMLLIFLLEDVERIFTGSDKAFGYFACCYHFWFTYTISFLFMCLRVLDVFGKVFIRGFEA